MVHAPRISDQVNSVNVDAGFDLLQDVNGAVKGLSPAEHVLFSRSLPHRLSAERFSPDLELNFTLAWELESTPVEIDAIRQATMEIWTLKAGELFHLRRGYVQRCPEVLRPLTEKLHIPFVH